MPLDPQFEEMIAMFSKMPSFSEMPLEIIRNAFAPMSLTPTPVDDVTDRTIQSPAGDLNLRIYRSGSGTSLPLLIFIHGGGFVVGGLDSHDEMARILTTETGCVTVAVDYRLAPENPFPAAPDDCLVALKWAAVQASELGADPQRIAVIGDSAGGNLAAVTALRARDEGGPALRGQVLIYPVTDLAKRLPAAPDGNYYILTPEDSKFFHRSYLSDPAHFRDPHASPALADNLQDLAPTLVITAEYDPLCAQGESFAQQLKEAGVDTKLTRYDGAIHGFATFPAPMGRQALTQMSDWLKARLA